MRSAAWFAVCLTIGSFACSGIKVTTDYDPSADFSGVGSYAWFDDRSGVQGDREDVTSLLDRRIRHAVDSEMASKGMKSVDRAQAKVLVTYHLGVETKLDVDTITTGYGYGGGYRGGYGGVGYGTQTTVREYQEGTLLIDMIEPSSNQLVWRGTGQARVNRSSTPEEREERVNEAVREILEKFPPAAKK